jgi:hypothetical protein
MSTVEERIASLEARADAMADLRSLIAEFRNETCRRFDETYGRFDAVDQRADRHFLYLDQKIDRQFAWIVGTQIALLLAVVGALAGAYYR